VTPVHLLQIPSFTNLVGASHMTATFPGHLCAVSSINSSFKYLVNAPHVSACVSHYHAQSKLLHFNILGAHLVAAISYLLTDDNKNTSLNVSFPPCMAPFVHLLPLHTLLIVVTVAYIRIFILFLWLWRSPLTKAGLSPSCELGCSYGSRNTFQADTRNRILCRVIRNIL
jgi:hypothetical protein